MRDEGSLKSPLQHVTGFLSAFGLDWSECFGSETEIVDRVVLDLCP